MRSARGTNQDALATSVCDSSLDRSMTVPVLVHALLASLVLPSSAFRADARHAARAKELGGAGAGIVEGEAWPWAQGEAMDFVVKILVKNPTKPGTTTLCTGSLVGPEGRFVLTAAHCVRHRPQPTLEDAMRNIRPDLVTATEIHVQLADGTTRRASSVHWHPGYAGWSQWDGALLEVFNVPYAPFEPAVSVQLASDLAGLRGRALWVAGFGATAGTGDVGELKVANLAVNADCEDGMCIATARSGLSSRMSTCEGDSGGPFFVAAGGAARAPGSAVRSVMIVGVNAESVGECGAKGKLTAFTGAPALERFISIWTKAPFATVDWESWQDPEPEDALKAWPAL